MRSKVGMWLAVVILTSLAFRATAAFFYVGFLTGDDVEILQEAAMSALGLDYAPWNLRNLLLPHLFIAPLFSLASVAEVVDGTSLARIGTLPFLIAATLNSLLVFWIGRRLLNERVGLAAAGVHSLHWLTLSFGSTVYPRTMTSLAILGATALLLGEKRGTCRGLVAGLLCSLAFAFRYSEVIFVLPLLGALWLLPLESVHRWRRAIALCLGFICGAFVFVGLGELWTSGGFATNFTEFFRYTLIERQASSAVAHQPVDWYLRRLPFWFFPTLLPFAFAGQRSRTAGALWLFIGIPLLILTLIHHKDLRYLQGIVPFLALVIGIGIDRFWARGWRVATICLLILSLAFSTRTALRHLERKSLAAVQAAQYLARQPDVHLVALSQSWAYGHRLILGNEVEILNLDTPPSPEEIEAAIAARVDTIGLYSEDLERHPELMNPLQAHEFIVEHEFSRGESKEVRLFSPAHPQR